MTAKKTILALALTLVVTLTGCSKFGFGAKNRAAIQNVVAPVCFQGLKKENINLLKKDDGTMAIHLKWEPVATDPSAKYEIYGDSKFSNLLGTTDQTEWELKNPVLAQDYIFSVKAITATCTDTNNQYHIYQAPLERPEFAGLTFAAGVSNTKVWLDWNASSSSKVKKYNIYLSKDLKNPVGKTTEVGVTVEGLARSSSYCFIVKAQDIWGIEDANTTEKCAETITETVPEFAGLKSVEQLQGKSGLTKLKLNWTKASGLVTGYKVYLSTSPKSQDFESAPRATVVGLDTVTALIDGLKSNTKYYFVVRAFYTSGTTTVSELNFIEKSNSTLESILPPIPPTLTTVEPSTGPFAGGNFVTITGTNFRQAISVKVDGKNCLTAPVVSLDGKTISCQIPAHTVSLTVVPVSITITNKDEDGLDDGTVTKNAAYTYSNKPAPVLSAISPQAGPLKGETLLTISGNYLDSTAQVFLDASECIGVKAVGTAINGVYTQLTCTNVSHAAGVVSLKVKNKDSQSFTLPNAFTYQGPPVLNSTKPISPSVGPVEGNIQVTIKGNNFDPGATVTIEGKVCTNPVRLTDSVDQSDLIQCTLPARANSQPGSVAVKVENSDKQYDVQIVFRYQGRPTITTLNPAIGSLAGRNKIDIIGSGFAIGSTDTHVRFGTEECTTVIVETANKITCFVPPSSIEKVVKVTVENPDHQTSTDDKFYTYRNSPVLTKTWPRYGAVAGGGTPVQFYGTGFVTGLSVSIDGKSCTGVIFSDSTFFTCVVPNGGFEHAANIVVTNPDGQLWNMSTPVYNYKDGIGQPGILSIAPKAGNTSGGYDLTINGLGFYDPTVQIGPTRQDCTVTNWTSSTITCTMPSASTTGAATIIVFNGGSGSTFNYYNTATPVTFNYSNLPPPVVDESSTLLSGPTAAKPSYTIRGSGFSNPGVKVYVAGGLVNCSSVSGTSLTCSLPAAVNQNSNSSVTITVENTDLQVDSYTYSYNFLQAPAVSAVSPNFGKIEGGKDLQISGSNFVATGITTVKIGNDSVCDVIPPVTPTLINCRTKPCNSESCRSGHTDPTPMDVKVTNPDGQFGIKSQAFTYRSAPKLLNVFPAYGTRAGGERVTILGSNFTEDITIELGGFPCTKEAATDILDNQFICRTSASPTDNIVNAVIRNTESQMDTLPLAYTYRDWGFIANSISPVVGPVHPHAYTDGVGANAKMMQPYLFAKIGNFLYFSDSYYHSVRKLNLLTNEVSTVSPNPKRSHGGGCSIGSAASSDFFRPDSIATDGVSLYLGIDYYCKMIIKMNPDTGFSERIAGQAGFPASLSDLTLGTADGNSFTSKLGYVLNMTILNGKLYFVEQTARKLRVIDLSNNIVSTLGGLPAALPSVYDNSVHLVNDGTIIYIVDMNHDKIRTYNPNLPFVLTDFTTVTHRIGEPIYSVSYYSGALYLALNYGNAANIHRIDIATKIQSRIVGEDYGQNPITDGATPVLGSIGSILADSNGIYISQIIYNSLIRKYDWPTQSVTTLTGDITAYRHASVDGNGDSARFMHQYAMAGDGENLYSSDLFTRVNGVYDLQVRKTNTLSPTKNISSLLMISKNLNNPAGGTSITVGMAVASDRNYVYIAGNHMIIRQSIADGTKQEVFAGAYNTAPSSKADALLTTDRKDARFGAAIYSMVVDGNYLYLNDYNYHLIRRIDLRTGVTSVFAGKGGAGKIEGDINNSQVCNVTSLVIVGEDLYFDEVGGNNGAPCAATSYSIRKANLITGQTSPVTTFITPKVFYSMTSDGKNIFTVDASYGTYNTILKIDLGTNAVSYITDSDPYNFAYTTETNGPIANAHVKDLKSLSFMQGKLFLGTEYNIRVVE